MVSEPSPSTRKRRRRSAERISEQLGAFPAHSLTAFQLRADHLNREGLPGKVVGVCVFELASMTVKSEFHVMWYPTSQSCGGRSPTGFKCGINCQHSAAWRRPGKSDANCVHDQQFQLPSQRSSRASTTSLTCCIPSVLSSHLGLFVFRLCWTCGPSRRARSKDGWLTRHLSTPTPHTVVHTVWFLTPFGSSYKSHFALWRVAITSSRLRTRTCSRSTSRGSRKQPEKVAVPWPLHFEINSWRFQFW